jgi:hypothetical protein
MGADVALGHPRFAQSLDAGRAALAPLPLAALEQLSRLHAEQALAMQRMEFLDGTADAALALMLMGAAAIMLGAGTALPLCFAWSLLMLIAIIGLAGCDLRVGQILCDTSEDGIRVTRAAKERRGVLLFAGMVWGSGAVLVLPPATEPIAALLFAVAPGAVLAARLRDRKSVLAFLTPLTGIVLATAVLSPWPNKGLDIALLLMLQSGIAAFAWRRHAAKGPAGLAWS